MIKIGDFSRVSRVPVKTLRYYDELGLLKPAVVDPITRYRYYSAEQIARLNRILALKDLGLSLEQIHQLLRDDLPAGQVMGMLRRRQVELEQEIQTSQAVLARIAARLDQFAKEQNMSEGDIVIKSVAAFHIASVRGVVPAYAEQGPLWHDLEKAMRKAGLQAAGPCFTIDHDDEYKPRDHDLEACFPVAGPAAIDAPARVYELPAVENMACLTHHGTFNDLMSRYQELLGWIDRNGWQICGPGREIYLFTGSGPVRQDDPSYVTEIQFPVKRAAA